MTRNYLLLVLGCVVIALIALSIKALETSASASVAVTWIPEQTPVTEQAERLAPAETVARTSTPQPRAVANDIEMVVQHAEVHDSDLVVDLCFSQPGQETWRLGHITLRYGNQNTEDLQGTVISNVAGTSASPGIQCDRLTFIGIVGSGGLSRTELSIDTMFMAAPDEGTQCEVYGRRIAESESLKAAGIRAECRASDGGNSFTIIEKPESMSDEEAQQQISDAATGFLAGPWVLVLPELGHTVGQ